MREDEEGNETPPFLEKIDLDSMGDVELVLGLEELYGISMEKERLEKVLNAGDLFDYLAELLAADSDRRRVCLTAAVFYRLRRGLEELAGRPLELRPETDIAELIAGLSGSRSISRTWADLESAARLVLPELCLGFSRRFPWLVSKIGPGDRRLADLARHAMALNHNHLAKEYGQNNVNDLWNSFRRLLAEAAAEERYELIGRETRLFP